MRSICVLELAEDGTVAFEKRDMATHRVQAMDGVNDGGNGVVISDVSLELGGTELTAIGRIQSLDFQIGGSY